MKKDFKMVQDALVMVLQLGINMLVPIFMCTLFGIWLGEQLGMNWLAVPFFFIGALAGYTSIFKMVKKFLKNRDGKRETNAKKNQ